VRAVVTGLWGRRRERVLDPAECGVDADQHGRRRPQPPRHLGHQCRGELERDEVHGLVTEKGEALGDSSGAVVHGFHADTGRTTHAGRIEDDHPAAG
jgi:hypothetical protein